MMDGCYLCNMVGCDDCSPETRRINDHNAMKDDVVYVKKSYPIKSTDKRLKRNRD